MASLFRSSGGGKSTILAGVENFDSILHPGESVRSTLNLALYWKGEMQHGQNMFRRLVLQHYSPRIDGEVVEPPISGVVWGGIPSEEHLQIIDKIKEYEIPLDVYWFDAGWYGQGCPVLFGFRRRLGPHGRRLATESELAQWNAQTGQRRRPRTGNEVSRLGRTMPRHSWPADHARTPQIIPQAMPTARSETGKRFFSISANLNH